LRSYFPGVPGYYNYDKRAWFAPQGQRLKSAADVLTTVYELNR
jgi:hypothetical protein